MNRHSFCTIPIFLLNFSINFIPIKNTCTVFCNNVFPAVIITSFIIVDWLIAFHSFAAI